MQIILFLLTNSICKFPPSPYFLLAVISGRLHKVYLHVTTYFLQRSWVLSTLLTASTKVRGLKNSFVVVVVVIVVVVVVVQPKQKFFSTIGRKLVGLLTLSKSNFMLKIKNTLPIFGYKMHFLLDKQLSICRIVQNQCPFL